MIVEALQPLPASEREKIMRSAREFLGMPTGNVSPDRSGEVPPVSHSVPVGSRSEDLVTRGKPKSLVELVNEKHPKTNTQLITLFAYYKERYEQADNFKRGDLKSYFSRARQKPAGNYDRDFSNAVQNGWVSQDGDDCYITSTGIEVVESGFSGETPTPRRNSTKAAPKKAPVKKARPAKRKTSRKK